MSISDYHTILAGLAETTSTEGSENDDGERPSECSVRRIPGRLRVVSHRHLHSADNLPNNKLSIHPAGPAPSTFLPTTTTFPCYIPCSGHLTHDKLFSPESKSHSHPSSTSSAFPSAGPRARTNTHLQHTLVHDHDDGKQHNPHIWLNLASKSSFQKPTVSLDVPPTFPVALTPVDAAIATLNAIPCHDSAPPTKYYPTRSIPPGTTRFKDPPLPSMSLHPLPSLVPASTLRPSRSTSHRIGISPIPSFQSRPASLDDPSPHRTICTRIDGPFVDVNVPLYTAAVEIDIPSYRCHQVLRSKSLPLPSIAIVVVDVHCKVLCSSAHLLSSMSFQRIVPFAPGLAPPPLRITTHSVEYQLNQPLPSTPRHRIVPFRINPPGLCGLRSLAAGTLWWERYHKVL
ncbi:hypothetical protein C8F01DRAFT_1244212 [Mycena amicta]|nr:hypothetical protein C8F01DRAFT_1244212 [Mycena amicta]